MNFIEVIALTVSISFLLIICANLAFKIEKLETKLREEISNKASEYRVHQIVERQWETIRKFDALCKHLSVTLELQEPKLVVKPTE